MNIEKIKELVTILKNSNYKDVFASIVIFEEISYLHELCDLNGGDIDFLEELYYNFIHSEATGLINDEIKSLINKEGV